jgi:hypothetical protein
MSRVCGLGARRLDCLAREGVGCNRREYSRQSHAAGDQHALGEYEPAQPGISCMG